MMLPILSEDSLSCLHETSSANTLRNASRGVLYESSRYFLNQSTTALIPSLLHSTNHRVDTNVITPEIGHYSTKHRADTIIITSEIGDYLTNHRPDAIAITSEIGYYLRLESCMISPPLNQAWFSRQSQIASHTIMYCDSCTNTV